MATLTDQDKQLIKDSGLFDAVWYFKRFADVAKVGLDPLEHYFRIGIYAGRDPGPLFSGRHYLEQLNGRRHAEVPVLDYLRQGWKEKLNPHPLFDVGYYLRNNSDIRRAGLEPLKHFLLHGHKENRNPSLHFRLSDYLEKHPQLQAQGINALIHYTSSNDYKSGAFIRNTEKPQEVLCSRILKRQSSAFDEKRESLFLAWLGRLSLPEQVYISEKLVSIILPTYNRAAKLPDAIKSVLAQTHARWELLIIDDGSSDNTEAVVAEFQDKRIKYHKINHLGVSAARNKGLEEAAGEYLFFLDSDNSYRPNHIQTLLSFMHIQDLDAAYAGLAVWNTKHAIFSYLQCDFDTRSLLDKNFIDMNAFAIKKFEYTIPFDTSIRRFVDWDFIIQNTIGRRMLYAPFIGVDYYNGDDADRITKNEYSHQDEMNLLFKHVHNKSTTRLKKILNSEQPCSQAYEKKRICVVLHVYHKKLINECLRYIQNIPAPTDLIITTSLDPSDPAFETIREQHPAASFIQYPNAGRDIGPFLALLPTLLKYDLVCKLHTKRDRSETGSLWRDLLLQSTVGTSELVAQIIGAFNNINVMAAGAAVLYKTGGVLSEVNWKHLEQICKQSGYPHPQRENWGFFAGSMFWARTKALSSLLHFSGQARFIVGSRAVDGDLEHAAERALGLAFCSHSNAQVALIDFEQNRVSLKIAPAQSSHDPELIPQTLARMVGRISPMMEKSNSTTVFPAHKREIDHQKDIQNKLSTSSENKAVALHSGLSLQSSNRMSAGSQSISVIVRSRSLGTDWLASVNSVIAQTLKADQIIFAVPAEMSQHLMEMLPKYFSEELENGVFLVAESSGILSADLANTGLSLATGDLIAYIDPGCVWANDFLFKMEATFAQQADISTAYSGIELHVPETGHRTIDIHPYSRRALLGFPFVNLQVFMHRRRVTSQTGLFDPSLGSDSDWDFILKSTKLYRPHLLGYPGALLPRQMTFHARRVSSETGHLATPMLEEKYRQERVKVGLDPLRIGYVLWDWPALSQTFVIEEIRYLLSRHIDVVVYYHTAPDKSAELDFQVESRLVKSHEELAALLRKDRRNLCHSHFAYPATTLLTWPACRSTNIPFTFFAHAVDIFHNQNKKRNRIGEVASDPLCLKVFVPGEYHRSVLEDAGVPLPKIAFALQAADREVFSKEFSIGQNTLPRQKAKGLFIGRFVPKKGLDVLVKAAAQLDPRRVEFFLHGYGPLHDEIKKIISDSQIKNVHLCEPLPNRAATAQAIADCDFLIVPSIVATDGDTEGFPTVIFEAMFAGKLVIASDVSSVPDYLQDMENALVVKANDSRSLAEGVNRFLSMPHRQKQAILSKARHFCSDHLGTDILIDFYFDVWKKNALDIFTVTYNTKENDCQNETMEILKRITSHTTTPHTLTIIDNGSSEDFVRNLIKFSEGKPNIRLVLQKDNMFVGPSSNTALSLSGSDYCIYMCSREAFIAKHGWERSLLRHMRNNPFEDLAGYQVHLPKYTLGKELVNHPEFSKFRNQDFAWENPEKVFLHVQGGCYIVKTSVLSEYGGFSTTVPHNSTDVEFSYFLESKGAKLGNVPGLVSITSKTLPKIQAVITEKSVVAHPLDTKSASALFVRPRDATRHFHCNICSYRGSKLSVSLICPACQSTPFGRKAFHLLAHNWRAHRKANAILLSHDQGFISAISGGMFHVLYSGVSLKDAVGMLLGSESKIQLFVMDGDVVSDFDSDQSLKMISPWIAPNALWLVSSLTPIDPAWNLKPLFYGSHLCEFDIKTTFISENIFC
jgi:glycosyltransferase involved in cell wall biosynthesis